MVSGDSNAYKLAFWVLSYILFDSALHNCIRDETAPAIRGNEIDLPYLTSNCPQLQAVYREAMRLTKRDVAVRKVVGDTKINGKTLRAGNATIVPSCQLHDNVSVFGKDHETFDAGRFLKSPELASSPTYKPYGGGRTQCPGRFFAVPEIFGFIALLIHRWDIELVRPEPDEGKIVNSQTFPRKDESTLTVGVSRPLPEDKVEVRLTYQEPVFQKVSHE